MDLPKWASWTFRDPYLPPSFHTGDFKDEKNLLHQRPINNRSMLVMVLGIGLGLRDIMRAMEIEADDLVAPLTLRRTVKRRKKHLRMPRGTLHSGRKRGEATEARSKVQRKHHRTQLKRLRLNLLVKQVLSPPMTGPSGSRLEQQLTGMQTQVPHHT